MQVIFPLNGRLTRRIGRLGLAPALAVLLLGTSEAAAAAPITIGQVPAATPSAACSSQRDTTQPTVTSGNTYVVPSTNGIVSWAVTQWSTFASPDAGQSFTMKIFRPVAGMTYTAVGRDGPHELAPGVLNTFSANVTAKPGDVLGLNSGPGGSNACNFDVPGETALVRLGDLADGESGDFGTTTPFFRVNIEAAITPRKDFFFASLTRHKRKGTATLTVDLPNPGELVVSGKGVRGTAAGAPIRVTGPGIVSLLIKPKGRTRRILDRTGEVKVRPKVSYTPTGGDTASQSRKLRLKKG